MEGNDYITMLLFVSAILGLLVVVLFILRWQAGVRRRLDFDPGKPLRQSIRGCGQINDVHFGYCSLQIIEYADGWLICVLPIWFFGVKWLPKDQTVVGSLQPATWYGLRRRLLECDSDSVLLEGALTDFVSPPTQVKMDTAILNKQ